jgi:hypothetical protein
VIVSDALFAQQEPGSWADRTICVDSPLSASSFTFSTTPPAPAATECRTFSGTYTVRRGCVRACGSRRKRNGGRGNRACGDQGPSGPAGAPPPQSARTVSPSQKVTNVAVLKQSTNGAQLDTDTQSAVIACPTAVITNTASYNATKNWAW